MLAPIKATGKRLLLAAVPDSDRLRFLAYKASFESWRKRQLGKHPIFTSREKMIDYINRELIGPKEMTYLEFGVFQGDSILYFAGIHENPRSRFVGFDTFEGLPENWTEFSRTLKSGHFSTGGKTPTTSDQRVSFVKGLFQQTLPGFLAGYAPNTQLVIHNDSDLYSATLYVLTRANDCIVPGTIVIFDELYSPMHEFRALQDYCGAYMREYEVIAATEGHAQVAIQMR